MTALSPPVIAAVEKICAEFPGTWHTRPKIVAALHSLAETVAEIMAGENAPARISTDLAQALEDLKTKAEDCAETIGEFEISSIYIDRAVALTREFDAREMEIYARVLEHKDDTIIEYSDKIAEQAAQIERLSGLLKQATDSLESRSLEDNKTPGHLSCMICGTDDDYELGPQHTPDCFISTARAALEEGAA